MRLGDSRPLGSRALFLGATSLLFSVLACRKYLLCCDKISLLCPWSHLPFYWLLWTIFLTFLYKGCHPVEAINPHMLWENILICVQAAALNYCWPGVPRSTLCFSLAQQGMMTTTNQPDILLFSLCCIAIFFPHGVLLMAYQSNRQLIINPCTGPPGKPKNTGVGSLSLLQGIFPIQELNRGLLHCRQILYQLSY